ncbi:MAG: cupin-like domain-containing protein [Pseudomonadales bacterium]
MPGEPTSATSTASGLPAMGVAARKLFSNEISTISLERDGWKVLREHIAAHTPALISDFSIASPALQAWTPERLSARYGHKRVRVYDASFGDPGKNYMNSIASMSFSDFLRETLGEGRDLRMFLYNAARQLPEMLADVTIPDVGLRFSRRFVYTFFGCKGSTTPLHYDIDMGHVLHTAIHGRRRVRLFAPEQSTALYRHPFTVRSYVNLDQPDVAAHPAIGCARGYEVVVEAGQALFMPSGYWHEYHYLDAGFGLSLRAGSPRLRDRARGAANLLTVSPLDRLGNSIAAGWWFDWKQRKAQERARAFMNKRGWA